MAGTAFLACGDMVRCLADRLHTVVAARAGLGRAGMIEPGELPLFGGMAGIAVGLGADVTGGQA